MTSLEELAPDVIVLLDTPRLDRILPDHHGPGARRVPIVTLATGDSRMASNLIQDTSLDELVQIVERTAHGELSRAKLLPVTRYKGAPLKASLKSSTSHEPQPQRLTPREDEIVNLLKRHLSNREIATRLGIEVATVKNHVHNVLEKLKVHRRSEAARLLNRGPRASSDSG